MLGTFLIGRRAAGACSAALLCVAAALMCSDAAQAARHVARHAASRGASPTLDAQAINAATLPTTSGKKRASAPGTAALIKEEILLDRAGFSPGQIDGQNGTNDQKGAHRVSGGKRAQADRPSRCGYLGAPDGDVG